MKLSLNICKRAPSVFISVTSLSLAGCGNDEIKQSKGYTPSEIVSYTYEVMQKAKIQGSKESIVLYGRKDSGDIYYDKDDSGVMSYSPGKQWTVYEQGTKKTYPVSVNEDGCAYDIYTDYDDDTIIVVYPVKADK